MLGFTYLNPPIKRYFLGRGSFNVPKNTVQRMRKIIIESSSNPYVRKWAEKMIEGVADRNELGEVTAVYNFLQRHTRYTKDPRGVEYIQTPPYVLKQLEIGDIPALDCFAKDQKIIVKHKTKERYSLKQVGELGESYKNYLALSYDFEAKQFVFKPITRWLDKGIKEVFLVKLKNGNSFKVTSEHDVICLVGKGRNNKFEPRKLALKDIDLSSYEMNRLPVAKQIPILNTQPGKSLDELWVEGLFVGDGCSANNACTIAVDNKPIQKKLFSLLKKFGLTFKLWTEENSGHKGGDYVYIHKHPYAQYLCNNFGGKADTKQFPEEYLSLNKIQLEALLDGYNTADGCTVTKGEWLGTLKTMYTTISNKLAEQLIFLHLLLGRNLWVGYQDIEHLKTLNIKKLYSKHSSWRLYERILSGKRKYSSGGEILPNVTSTKIKSITSLGKQPVCDLTVQDTHNVVLSHGLIIGQCDDYTTTGLSLLRSLGYKTGIRTAGYKPNKHFSHVYGLVLIKGDWIVFDPVRKDKELGWEAPNPTIKEDARV